MKNIFAFFIIAGIIISSSCKKEEKSERFLLLTGPTWAADSLLAGGVDASGPGQVLENFKGDAKFNVNGTGDFGNYSGQWRFNDTETELTIITDDLPVPINCSIIELTTLSLKITAIVPDMNNPPAMLDIRMTFKSK